MAVRGRLQAVLVLMVTLVVAAGCVEEPPPSGNTHGSTRRVSVAPDGSQLDQPSGTASVSGDGRFVAFESVGDVFVRDWAAGTTEKMPALFDGDGNPRVSFQPFISADGRYVVFTSKTIDMLAIDVFVWDRSSGTTALLARDSFAPAISADGRYVVFVSRADEPSLGDSNGVPDVFLLDRLTETMEWISVPAVDADDDPFASDWAYGPSVSADGRYVAFTSRARNLVPGDGNGMPDVFVRDRNG